MSKALTKYKTSAVTRTRSNPKSGKIFDFTPGNLLVLAGLLIIFYFLIKTRKQLPAAGTYKNTEKWRVDKVNADGIPIEITIERNFTRT